MLNKREKIFKILRKNSKLTIFLIYSLVALISFWPLFLGKAVINWDALDLWMPWKHFIVDELYAGNLPLWNPYFKDGFPQHGDTMTWYPISWVIGFLFGGYNLSALNFEYLFHVILSGVGMYFFSKRFCCFNKINFLVGLSYMLSGFIIGNAQHISWIISAAWIPIYFALIYDIYKSAPKVPTVARLSLVGFFLFSGGYLAIFFICLYMTLGIFLWKVYKVKNIPWRHIGYLLSAFLIIALLSLPLLFSAFDIFPLLNRFNPKSISGFNINYGSTPLNGLLSIILPLSSGIYNNGEIEFGTFSTYFGTIPFLFILLRLKLIFYSKKYLVLFALSLIFLFASLGSLSPIRDLLGYLPLLDLFRYPTIFRLFYIFLSLLLVSITLNSSLISLKSLLKTKKREIKIILLFTSFLLFTIGLWLLIKNHSQIGLYFSNIFTYKPLEYLNIDSRISINLMFLASGFLVLLLWGFRSHLLAGKIVFAFWLFEIIFVSMSSAPHSVFHPVDVKWSNILIDAQPKKISEIHPRHSKYESNNWESYLDFSWKSKTFYLKQFSRLWYNPLELNTLNSTSIEYNSKSVFGYKNGSNAILSNDSILFTPKSCQKWFFEIPKHFKDSLFIRQNYIHHFKAYAGNKELPITPSKSGFMLIDLKNSFSEVVIIEYQKNNYFVLFILSTCLLLLLLGVAFFYEKNKLIYSIFLIVFLTFGITNNINRFFIPLSSKESKPTYLAGQHFNNSPLFDQQFFKDYNDTLYIERDIIKNDMQVSSVHLNFPHIENVIKLPDETIIEQRLKSDVKPFFLLENMFSDTIFQMDLKSMLHSIENKAIFIEFSYENNPSSSTKFWISQKRNGKWIDGKAWTLHTDNSKNVVKTVVLPIDISRFHILPDDKLNLYTWGNNSQTCKWKSIKFYYVP